jgi:hypothetical protein
VECVSYLANHWKLKEKGTISHYIIVLSPVYSVQYLWQEIEWDAVYHLTLHRDVLNAIIVMLVKCVSVKPVSIGVYSLNFLVVSLKFQDKLVSITNMWVSWWQNAWLDWSFTSTNFKTKWNYDREIFRNQVIWPIIQLSWIESIVGTQN